MSAEEIPGNLRELKRKEFLERKRRQRLRENEELRELEKNLRTAYYVKNLKEQQAQLEARKKDALRTKQEESLQIQAQLKRNEEYLKEEAITEQQKKDKFRADLCDQMSESLIRRQKRVEEMASERDTVDRLLKSLKIEQEHEKKELEERREKMKKDLEDFMQQQEAYRRKERELDEQERLRADTVQRQRDEEKKRLEELKKLERLQQNNLSEKIGLDLHKSELEKRRRENVMLDLLEEERKAKEDNYFRQNIERQLRARERVRWELQCFIDQRKLEKEVEKRNKLAAEREEMIKIIAETEKAAASEIQRLREKEQSYNQAIQQMLEERRKQRASDMSSHLRDYELVRGEERKIQMEIEEERMRLLQSHPSDILRYLPAGVLRDSDREFLALPPGKSKP